MILQLQAKVHGLGNLGVLSCTHPNLNDFKATFWIIRIIILITRALRSKGGRSLLFWELLATSAPWFVGRLIGWLVGWLVAWSVGRVIGWLVCWLVG